MCVCVCVCVCVCYFFSPAVSEKGGREAKEEREEGGGGDGVDVEALQSKLSDYREIIGRQEEMLEVAPPPPHTHTHTHTLFCCCWWK